MKTLREYITDAEEQKVAIGHFNITTIGMFWGIMEAAVAVSGEFGSKLPVVIGVSGGERDYFGVSSIAYVVKGVREEMQYPVFLNADHTYEVSDVKAAIDAGYDMVIYDGLKVSHEENLVRTKEVVEYRNQKNPACLVEAELGFIGSGSNLKDEIPEGVSATSMTTPDDARAFVEDTGIDLLAPSVGNVHGMVKSGNPALDPERITAIRRAGGVPLVLHGGSGVSDSDFSKSIDAGISMIHISTELRLAFKEALKESINTSEEAAPYKYITPAKQAVSLVAAQRLRLFNKMI